MPHSTLNNNMTSTAILILFVNLSLVSSTTHFVYWNTTNPVFRIDNTDNIMDVNAGSEYDQMHLICPNSGERHVVYSVSREEYVSCRVSNPRPKIVAICDQPGGFRYFTITFRNFSPTPGGLEFKAGESYYFISTSTSRDLHRRAGGYCSTHNMKMVLNVGGEPAPLPPPVNDVVSVNVPRETTTSPSPRAWRATEKTPQFYQPRNAQVYNSRNPQDRQIYYYKPWNRNNYANKFVKIEPLASNSVLQALPLTSSAASSVTAPLIVILLTYLAFH